MLSQFLVKIARKLDQQIAVHVLIIRDTHLALVYTMGDLDAVYIELNGIHGMPIQLENHATKVILQLVVM